MRIIRWILAALIVFGTSAVWWGTSRGTLRNSQPARLAHPGAGYQVEDRFSLASPGRFQLQIATPASPTEVQQLHRKQPDIPCDLELSVTGPDFSVRRNITKLRNGGWSSDQNLFFPAGDGGLMFLPHTGEYEITLRSKLDVPTFMERGAVVTLLRWENVGSALGWGLALLVGYCCLGAAAVVAVVLAKRGT